MKYSTITSITMTAFSSFAIGANVPVDILCCQYNETSYGSGESAPAPAPAPKAAPAAADSSGLGY
ncbi:hypothetical protein DSO57_1013394 [Entomophthora muscae]|uniref:Uncharacterized protein n=1 Tax=Entomophthora muscae TaxID=34485 RepID=A0ACC2S7V9_9FUNG|nr:hypothetical protein DSO57_1013394 [Entomophthora muscae]